MCTSPKQTGSDPCAGISAPTKVCVLLSGILALYRSRLTLFVSKSHHLSCNDVCKIRPSMRSKTDFLKRMCMLQQESSGQQPILSAFEGREHYGMPSAVCVRHSFLLAIYFLYTAFDSRTFMRWGRLSHYRNGTKTGEGDSITWTLDFAVCIR